MPDTSVLLIQVIVRVTKISKIMFETETELANFMIREHLVRDPETGYIRNSEGIVNPYCFSYRDGNRWCTMVGIALDLHEALNRLNKIINGGEQRTILIERANDLEKYSKVWVPGRGIIDYTEWKNGHNS